MAKEYRFEMRLDETYVRKLREIAEEYGTTTSDAVRRAIDEAHWKAGEPRRREIVRRMAEANLEDVPDMDTLKRQLGRHPDYLQDDVADSR